MWDGDHYDYIQGDKISNWKDCGIYCQSSQLCQAWTIDSSLGCFVFEQTSPNLKYEQGFISGDKDCPGKMFKALHFTQKHRLPNAWLCMII